MFGKEMWSQRRKERDQGRRRESFNCLGFFVMSWRWRAVELGTDCANTKLEDC